MSIAEGATSAISMFQAMQRNRMARDELEYQRQQDAINRADRLAESRALAEYRRDTLQQSADQFAAGEGQRAATLALTEAQVEGASLDNEGKRITNQTAGLTLKGQQNDVIRNQYAALDIIDPTDPSKLNRPRLAEGIRSGNKPIVDAVLTQITSQINIPAGSKAVGIDTLPDGALVIRIQNEDGSIGVLTEDGSSDPNSKTVRFTPESLAKYAEWGYQTGVVANSSLNMGEFRGMQGVIEAGFQNEAEVVTALPPQAQRVASAVIASAETEEERAQVTDAIAQDAGLTPRAQVLLEQRRQAQERGKLGGNQERTTARIAEIDAELAELGFKNSGTRTEAAQIVASTENLTGPQINEAVESGALTVTPELQSETADMMRKAGVEELQQLKRLKAKELALAKAVLMASTKDSTLRNSIATQIDNIIETGSPSMSRKDVIDDRRADKQLEVSFGNLEATWARIAAQEGATKQQRIDNAVEAAKASVENTSKIFFSDDGSPNLSTTNAQRWSREVLPGAMRALRLATSNEEADAIMDGINQGASLALASYADDQGLSILGFDAIYESVANYWRPDADDTASATDFAASRVEVTKDATGNPEYFYFLDANMEQTDRAVSARRIQEIDPALYRFLLDAGRRNREAILKARAEG
jgi:hypothetical protein